jgi:hypothetical protein
MVIRYFLPKVLLRKRKPSIYNIDKLVDMKQYILDVVEENPGALFYPLTGAFVVNGDTIAMTSAATIAATSATTTALTSGTGTTVTATTGNISLVATHANGRVLVDGTKLRLNALALLLENATAYANDAAAATGNINVGALYIHTDGFVHVRLS